MSISKIVQTAQQTETALAGQINAQAGLLDRVGTTVVQDALTNLEVAARGARDRLAAVRVALLGGECPATSELAALGDELAHLADLFAVCPPPAPFPVPTVLNLPPAPDDELVALSAPDGQEVLQVAACTTADGSLVWTKQDKDTYESACRRYRLVRLAPGGRVWQMRVYDAIHGWGEVSADYATRWGKAEGTLSQLKTYAAEYAGQNNG